MDFKQLRSFVTVADCGSFTQAAVRLYTSQPTVSAHIRQLEDELHETLFLRTTKSLAITARGQELYDYAVKPYMEGLKIRSHPATDDFLINCSCDIIKRYKPDLLMIHPANIDSYRHRSGVYSELVPDLK